MKVCVLTGSRIPVAETERWKDFLAEMAVKGISCDQHYLQTPGSSSPLELLNDPLFSNQFQQLFNRQRIRFALLEVNANHSDPSEPPAWLERIHWRPAAGTGIQDIIKQLHSVDVAWIHIWWPPSGPASPAAKRLCGTETADDDSDRDELLFFRRFIDELCVHNSHDQAAAAQYEGRLNIVTFLGGQPFEIPDRFETLLSECTIRVPCFLQQAQTEARRVGTISGTRDLCATILEALKEPCGDELIEESLPSADNDAPIPLQQLLSGRSSLQCPNSRWIPIRGTEIRAVRSADFLYVESAAAVEYPSDGQQASVALYAKPDDVQNVHNVAGDYPSVTEAFHEHLHRQHGS